MLDGSLNHTQCIKLKKNKTVPQRVWLGMEKWMGLLSSGDTSQITTEEEGTNFPQEAAERRKEGKKLVIKERDRKRSLVALRGSF